MISVSAKFSIFFRSVATIMLELSGDFFAEGSILEDPLKGPDFYAVLANSTTVQYISVRFERKQKVLEQYH
jgi:hypothetical protein